MAPFLKWNTDRDVSEIISEFPIKFKNYFDPFLNAGEIFFNLYGNGRIFEKGFLSTSTNWVLVECYRSVMNEPERLQRMLSYTLEKNCLSMFNQLKVSLQTPVSYIYVDRASDEKGNWRASQFLDRNKKISVDVSDIDRCSRYLNLWCGNVWCTHWEDSLTRANAGDVVYLDPPKIPFTSSGHIDYVTNGFNESNYIYLNNYSKQLKKQGIFVCLVNSNTPATLRIFGEPKKTLKSGELMYVY